MLDILQFAFSPVPIAAADLEVAALATPVDVGDVTVAVGEADRFSSGDITYQAIMNISV